jgi:hypothetical protein
MRIQRVIAGLAMGIAFFGFVGHVVLNWSPEDSLARIGAALYAALLIGAVVLSALRKVQTNDG